MTQLCISVDVEQDLPGILPRSTLGIDQGVPRLLEILDEFKVRADFFFLSSVVLDQPKIVDSVVDRGHVVGNHGLNHELLCAMPIERQRREIESSSTQLQEFLGKPPKMYRAANFSVNIATLQLLQEFGYRIDSSVLPGRVLRRSHMLKIYDHRNASSRPFRPFAAASKFDSNTLLEIPVTGNPLRSGAPFGLGGLNLFGPDLILGALGSMKMEVVTFLIHPWELVDLSSAWPSLPSGYRAACSSSLKALRSFLEGARDLSEFSTLEAVARDLP